MHPFLPRLLVILAGAGAPVSAAGSSAATHVAAPGGPGWACHVIDNTGRGSDGTKLHDINGDGRLDITTGWEEDGSTRVYLNPGPAAAKQPWPRVIVGTTPSAEDAVFADLDGDGNFDVVSSTEGSSRRVFAHWGPPAARLLDAAAWKQEAMPALAGKTRWMFAQPLQIDGRHGVDLVLGGKRGGEDKQSVLGWLEAPREGRNLADWKWHHLQVTGWIMTIHLEDMDGDGDADLLCSDRYGDARGVYWLENPGAEKAAGGASWRRHAVGASAVHQVLFIGVGDIDGDGLRDIAAPVTLAATEQQAPNRSSRIVWFKRLDRSGTRWSEHAIAVPENTGNVKCVTIGDLDGDRQPELVVSCENARGPRIGVYALRHDGDPRAEQWTALNISGEPGIKFDLVHLLDLDADGDLDVLTNEEQEDRRGLGVVWYENPGVRR